MKSGIRMSIAAGVGLLLVMAAATGRAQERSSKYYRDAASQSKKSAIVFKEIMTAPDKGIPGDVLDRAECVAVFPSVIKAGFGFGGRGGRGVASCRTEAGWSAPAFFDLKGGSFGLQIGVQSTDFILLFMNTRGLDRLIGDKFEIGGEGSVAAGPVGRQAGASTNIRLDAEILSYSRSKGLFAGLELKGVVITQDKDDIRAVYGHDADARGVLKDSKYTAPPDVRAFPARLAHYSSRRAKLHEALIANHRYKRPV
ncbi:MAG TPA: lipid-binding SYLF domain-containing protein [Blastocatellia bacterium]|nr:lipid-binding SYLF domain-containing protein [Blastocatellia bacterium]